MSDNSRIAVDWPKRGRDLAIYLAIGLFLAIINPFGSISGSSFWVAAAYWVSLVVLGSLAGEVSTWAVGRVLPRLSDWGVVPIVATLTAAAILPMLLLVEWVSRGETIAPKDWPRTFVFIWIISLAITTVAMLIRRATEKQDAAAPADAPAPARPAFMDRLPVRLRSAVLYAVQAEDHYLRVHTSAGQEMILMRLADALRELTGVEGMQTHRSWWVAREGLADASRDSGRVVLKLKSGVEAPVSRTYQASVRDAGWI